MLEIFKYLLISLMLGCVLWLMIYVIKNKQPFKTFLLSGICGVSALFLVNLIGLVTGDTLEINLCTICTSSFLGIPGVILMILVKIFWTF